MANLRDRIQPEAVARLFNLGETTTRRSWSKSEYGRILRHQLDAPLIACTPCSSADALVTGDLPALAGSEIKTLRELLMHPAPPMELLRLTKQFFKEAGHCNDHPLPHEVAIVLYYSLIIVTWRQHREWITALNIQDLTSGIAWSLRQTWLDEQIRTLLEAGV